MSERPAPTGEEIKRDNQKILERYFPDIFAGNLNSIRSFFAEADHFVLQELTEDQDQRRLSAMAYDSRSSDQMNIRYKASSDFKWEVRVSLLKFSHNLEFLWGGEKSVEDLELTLENQKGIPLKINVDSGAGTIKIGPKEHKISLYQGFNDKKFEDLRRRGKSSESFRLVDGAILDESNLFALSYTAGSVIKKETLILPARLTQPLLEF